MRCRARSSSSSGTSSTATGIACRQARIGHAVRVPTTRTVPQHSGRSLAIGPEGRWPKEESMRVLVTGATGNVGRIVVEQLVAAGVRVRAMTRRPERARFPEAVEPVAGDLADPATLAPEMAGVDRVYAFPV